MTEGAVEHHTLETVGRIVRLLDARGVRSALVGAAALAVHGYSRATDDVDVGIATPSLEDLRNIGADLRHALGLDVDVAMPDAEDPLGGVITIRGANIRQIQVINFGDHPGREAVLLAVAVPLGDAAAGVVDLAHLVAMKLFAGGLKSKADVVEVLAYNPEADLGAIAALCARHGLKDEWSALLPDVLARRESR